MSFVESMKKRDFTALLCFDFHLIFYSDGLGIYKILFLLPGCLPSFS